MLNYTLGSSMHTLTHWQSARASEKWSSWTDGEISLCTGGASPHYIYSSEGDLFAIEQGIIGSDFPEGFVFQHFFFSVSTQNRLRFRMDGNTAGNPPHHYYYSPPISFDGVFDVWGNQVTKDQYIGRPEPEDRAAWTLIGYVETIYPGTVHYFDPLEDFDSGTWYSSFMDDPSITLYDDDGKEYTWKHLYLQMYKGRPIYDT